MGMYTLFKFTGLLKNEFVSDINKLLEEDNQWINFASKYEFAKHFADLPRSDMIPFGAISAYNEEKTGSKYANIIDSWDPWDIGSYYTLTFNCDLKNYDDEIEAFINEIAINICSEFIAESWYEESNFPIIYYGKDGKLSNVN